jgi:uncharacterized protein with von Willebrand factor type A (vWA) domain
MTEPRPPDLAEVTASLGRLLHLAGVPVTADRSGRLAAVLVLQPPVTRAELYWCARVTLLTGHEQIELFDRVFSQVFAGVVDPAEWRGDQPRSTALRRGERRRSQPGGDGLESPTGGNQPGAVLPASGASAGEAEQEGVAVAASSEERLASRDFASLDPDELIALRDLAGRMAVAPPPRRSRRRVRSPNGSHLDVRATLRRARRSGGEPLVPVRRHRRSRPRRLVLICDISGSMEPFARAYLQLLLSGVSASQAEAFVFATRLTRLTRELKSSSPAAALARAGRAAPDWSGGTRIGEAMKTFNTDHGRRGVARGAVVVIISDGWDRGDPVLLGEEMARLKRMAHSIIWVNPRKASPAFQPLTAGMAAAVPHIDRLLSGHTLEAFAEVLAAIGEVRSGTSERGGPVEGVK